MVVEEVDVLLPPLTMMSGNPVKRYVHIPSHRPFYIKINVSI